MKKIHLSIKSIQALHISNVDRVQTGGKHLNELIAGERSSLVRGSEELKSSDIGKRACMQLWCAFCFKISG